jgi:biopolymer transport protein ExbB/TolQ
MNNENFLESRAFFMIVGVVIMAFIIAILSLALAEGSGSAKLLLDKSAPDQTFPYPLTIQNFMWLMLGLGIGDVLHRRAWVGRELRAARAKLLPEDAHTMITPDEVAALRQKVLSSKYATPGFIHQVIDESLLYFQVNRSVETAHQMVTSMVDLELHRVDLRYTNLRYLAWLIPTAGFIGTVVGIAGALAFLKVGGESADQDMGRVINALAMAFNTTILALIFAAVLVFLIQGTQKKEEDAINHCSQYCLKNLVNRLYVP